MNIGPDGEGGGIGQVAHRRHELGKRDVAMGCCLLGSRNRLIDVNFVVISGQADEPQQLCKDFARLVTLQNRIRHSDCARINEGIAGNAILLFKLQDRIEGQSLRLAAHTGPKLIAQAPQSDRKGEYFGNRLDGKGHIGIACAQ